MKKAGYLALTMLLPLAIAHPAFVNAQTDQPAAPAAATTGPLIPQDQVLVIQDEQRGQQNQLQKLQGTVQEMKGVQEKQGATINKLTDRTDQAVSTANMANTNAAKALNDGIDAKETVVRTGNQLNQKIDTRLDEATGKIDQKIDSTIGDRISAVKRSLFVTRVWFAGFVTVSFFLFAVIGLRKKPMSEEQIERLVEDRVTAGIVEWISRKQHMDKTVPELREAWKEARSFYPEGELLLTNGVRLTKDKTREHDREGTVMYRFKFNSNNPSPSEEPRHFYGNEQLAHNDLRKHAARILFEQSAGTEPTLPTPKVVIEQCTWEADTPVNRGDTTQYLRNIVETTQTYQKQKIAS